MVAVNINVKEINTDQASFGPLPDGNYRLQVKEIKVVEDNNRKTVKATNEVLEPAKFAGRIVFENYNIQHSNPTAQEIGLQKMGSLARACGIFDLYDTDQMLMLPFMARVGMSKPKPGYEQRNEIKRYYFPDEGAVPEPRVSERQPNTGAPAHGAPAPQPAMAAKSRPWAK